MSDSNRMYRVRKDGRIPLGPKPASKADAWRVLTPQAKAKLLELRQGGAKDMGGTPGEAPYWKSQEYGEPLAHIDARNYIAKAMRQFRSQLPSIMDAWLRS